MISKLNSPAATYSSANFCSLFSTNFDGLSGHNWWIYGCICWTEICSKVTTNYVCRRQSHNYQFHFGISFDMANLCFYMNIISFRNVIFEFVCWLIDRFLNFMREHFKTCSGRVSAVAHVLVEAFA